MKKSTVGSGQKSGSKLPKDRGVNHILILDEGKRGGENPTKQKMSAMRSSGQKNKFLRGKGEASED